MRALDGKEVCGREVRVQVARNKRPEDPKTYYTKGFVLYTIY